MKALVLDTYYQAFLDTIKTTDLPYEQDLRSLLDLCFGTFDAYSHYLGELGWECRDVVANYPSLQLKWAAENGFNGEHGLHAISMDQIREFDPEVVILQDVSWFSQTALEAISRRHILAAQISCPFPEEEKVKLLDVVFTSFPHYIPRIEALGVKAVYLPLAYDPRIGPRLATQNRPYDCVFVGGVGLPSHWAAGMNVLSAVAKAVPSSRFYGYGYELLPASSALCNQHYGPAFGLEMYEIICHAKICLNRHGEVSQNYANNLRMFEATGSGALLVTDNKSNIHDFFADDECVTYDSPDDAVDKIRWYLDYPWLAAAIATRGQKRTLKDHGYSQRIPVVSETLKGLIHA